jgi:hypothetical protein
MTDITKAPKPMKWSGGEHAMTLNHPWVRNVLSIRGLPGDYGTTPSACFKRFEEGVFSTDDVERIIYLGLIGGGLSLSEADALVLRFVRSRPIMENHTVAVSVLATLFSDVETEAA